MKISFISADSVIAGSFSGKLKPVCELAGKAVFAAAEFGIASVIVKETGVIGAVTIAVLVVLKMCMEME